jgi:hypothetical protein
MHNSEMFFRFFKSSSRKLSNEHITTIKSSTKTYLDSRIVKNLLKVKKMFCKIIYMHILVHIYMLCAILNNIFTYLDRISRGTARGYQLV